MKGDRLWNVVKAAKGLNLSALQQMGYHVGEAKLEKYHNLRPKPKTIRELKVALKLMWEDLPLEPINKVNKNFTKRLRTCVVTGGGHIEHKL